MTHRNSFAICLFATSCLWTIPALAAGPTVSGAWIRTVPGTDIAAGYFTLRNSGTKPLKLIAAQSPACEMLMLHQSQNLGGMSKMVEVAEVTIGTGEVMVFAPGGYHLMCMGPAPSLKPGTTANVSLQFEGGTTLQVKFVVKGPTGK